MSMHNYANAGPNRAALAALIELGSNPLAGAKIAPVATPEVKRHRAAWKARRIADDSDFSDLTREQVAAALRFTAECIERDDPKMVESPFDEALYRFHRRCWERAVDNAYLKLIAE